jgi:hypothetical protein
MVWRREGTMVQDEGKVEGQQKSSEFKVTWRDAKHAQIKCGRPYPLTSIVRSQQPNWLSDHLESYRQPSGCLNEYTQLSSISCILYGILHSILEDPYTFHKILGRNIQYWDEPHRCRKWKQARLKAALMYGQIQGSLVLDCWVET